MQNFKDKCNLLRLIHKLRDKYVLIEKASNVSALWSWRSLYYTWFIFSSSCFLSSCAIQLPFTCSPELVARIAREHACSLLQCHSWHSALPATFAHAISWPVCTRPVTWLQYLGKALWAERKYSALQEKLGRSGVPHCCWDWFLKAEPAEIQFCGSQLIF